MSVWTRIFTQAIWAGILFFLLFFLLANIFLSFFIGLIIMDWGSTKEVFAWIFSRNYSLIILWLMFLLAFKWSEKKLTLTQHFLLVFILGIFMVGLSFIDLFIQFATDPNIDFNEEFYQVLEIFTSPFLGAVLLLFFAPLVYKFRNSLKLKALYYE